LPDQQRLHLSQEGRKELAHIVGRMRDHNQLASLSEAGLFIGAGRYSHTRRYYKPKAGGTNETHLVFSWMDERSSERANWQ
jgi:hypothetical protein